MDRVFLDANVLFSAAYRKDSGLRRLWHLPDVELLSSPYAREEARRNLANRSQRDRLTRLVRKVTLVADPEGEQAWPEGLDLPEKDRPIFWAALAGNASHLLTGDLKHFRRYFGKKIEGILILPPAKYLQIREESAEPE